VTANLLLSLPVRHNLAKFRLRAWRLPSSEHNVHSNIKILLLIHHIVLSYACMYCFITVTEHTKFINHENFKKRSIKYILKYHCLFCSTSFLLILSEVTVLGKAVCLINCEETLPGGNFAVSCVHHNESFNSLTIHKTYSYAI